MLPDRLIASTTAPVAPASLPPRLLPLGALAAGFGLLHGAALAQVTPPAAPASAASAAAPGTAPRPAASGTTLAPVSVKAKAETDQDSVRATTSTIGRGNQELRDIPQSVTVVTEKLMDDRRADTVKEALHYTAGISFQAAEGGEEDIRLRGFSLTASGDIYVDSVRDPAFYDRDVFNFDRIELLRGSASMLFGRGSTGGIVNQVSKQALLADVSEVSVTAGSGSYLRFTGDFNVKTSDSSGLRLNVMANQADNFGVPIDKYAVAPTFRWGIGTADEFAISGYYLNNDNGINYGLPWLRNAAGETELLKVSPRAYYGLASDRNSGTAGYLTLDHTHRFAGGAAWHTVVRDGNFKRDLRASTIRFCTRSTANPDCPTAVTPATVSDATILTRGTQNKVQDLHTTYLQSDFNAKTNWFGMKHDVLTGIDLGREEFNNYTTGPATLIAKPRTRVGTPDDGAAVDESLRPKVLNRNFVAKAVGLYAQDLVEFVPHWKLLAGLRWDRFEGDYFSPTAAVAARELERSDSLWSHRLGLLWQPTDQASYYVSYGTSFNTSGELYLYDLPGSNAPPEKSRNFELGAKLDLFDGRVSARAAAFHSTKYNERNRDSPTGQPIVDYLLSGERHAAGFELDLAGRITPAWEVYGSYAWIPSAKIDKAEVNGTATGEREGDRPSMTPRHSGSIFSTYQVTPAIRLGGGLNARGAQEFNRGGVRVSARHYVTADLFGEYQLNEQVAFKLNVNNVTDKLYADQLYVGHYVVGQPRTVYVTMTARF